MNVMSFVKQASTSINPLPYPFSFLVNFLRPHRCEAKTGSYLIVIRHSYHHHFLHCDTIPSFESSRTVLGCSEPGFGPPQMESILTPPVKVPTRPLV